MRIKTLDLLLIASILAIPLLVGWSYLRPRTTFMEQQSASNDVAGLQLAIRSLEREGDELHVTYAFRWAAFKKRDFFFMRRFGGVGISFFDANGCQLPPDRTNAEFWLDEDFAYGKKGSSQHDALVTIPGGARYVALQYGRLAGKRVAIPEAGEGP